MRPTGGIGSPRRRATRAATRSGRCSRSSGAFRTKNAVSAGRGDGARGLGGAAHDGGLGAAGGGDGLHGRGARPGDPDAAREQRDGADARPEGDAGPVCGWRGDAHRRGAGAGAACGCGCGAGPGAGQPEDQPGGVRAGGRASAERAGGAAAEHAGAQEPEREHRDRLAREPRRGRGAVSGAGGAVQHRFDPGRAAADGAAGGQLRAAVRSRRYRSRRSRRRR